MSNKNNWPLIFEALIQNKLLVLRVNFMAIGGILLLLALGISFALTADGFLMIFIGLAIYIPSFRRPLLARVTTNTTTDLVSHDSLGGLDWHSHSLYCFRHDTSSR